MTGFVTPHAAIFAAPQPRVPAPDQTLGELWADPKFGEDPVGLMCELVDTYGEERALALWMWATLRLRLEKQRLIRSLLFVQRQQGEAA